MSRLFWLRITVAIGCFLILELVLRILGFGHLPLYYESNIYEYALVPNQNLKRFGNLFYINEFEMRSDELNENEVRFLGFGDSVLNGGIATSQEDLASSILNERLQVLDKKNRFLNVSSGSWGVSNAFLWMQENIHFRPAAIILCFSSHDWVDQMQFQRVVGQTSYYPKEQPLLAVSDCLSWLWPRFISDVEWEQLEIVEGVEIPRHSFDQGWKYFVEFSIENNIDLIVYHHPELEELDAGHWNEEGLALEYFLDSCRVNRISGLEIGLTPNDYRDDIHPNENGQKKMADHLFPSLKTLMDESK